jgi:hypothetical protein
MVCYQVAYSIHYVARSASRREREIGVRCKLQEQLRTTVLHWVVPTVMHSAYAFSSRSMDCNGGFENSFAPKQAGGALGIQLEAWLRDV